MFRVMGKIKSDKRGFTLVELLVTMSVLVIALTLTVQLMGIIWDNYRKVEYRWIVQTAVEYVAGCFQRDANREALATADECDLYYEALPAADSTGTTQFTLSSVPELGQITYDAATHTIALDANALTEAKKDILTGEKSIFFLSYDNHFYVIRYDDLFAAKETATEGDEDPFEYYAITKYPIAQDLNLIDPSKADVQVKVDFAISGNPLAYDTDNHEESQTAAFTKYLMGGVTATVNGMIQDANLVYEKNATEYVSSIDLQNIDADKGESVNVKGGKLSSKYVAGWDKGSALGYPGTDEIPSTAPDGDPSNPSSTANVVKYHSVNTPKEDLEVGTQDKNFNISATMSPCLFNAAIRGVENGKEILQPIRDFRDNVLRGTWLGDRIIGLYYHAVSPVVVSAMRTTPVLRAAVREVTVDLSAILAMVE